MNEKPIIILGSARKHGDTRKWVDSVFAGIEHTIIDLLDYHISPYNYSHEYPTGDEFLKVANALLAHKTIVFATPVYWYAMSGLMKTFFDRFTDLLNTQKHIGRQLKGKSVFLLAAGSDESLPDGFEVPFQLTAEYLGMVYQSCLYCPTGYLGSKDELDILVKLFVNKLLLP